MTAVEDGPEITTSTTPTTAHRPPMMDVKDTAGGAGDNDRVGSTQMDPVLGRVVVERQQLVQIVGDLRDGLAELGPVGCVEGFHRVQGVPAILGVPDLRQRFLRPGVRRLR